MARYFNASAIDLDDSQLYDSSGLSESEDELPSGLSTGKSSNRALQDAMEQDDSDLENDSGTCAFIHSNSGCCWLVR